MKKILALAIAAALASPMALADNPPSNVGDVTYLGNIVANSPMWQWTVNDYPGGRLDAKPSEVKETNGTYTYPLNGQAFIAASGYLPASTGINISSGPGSYIGTQDKTSLTDQNGASPRDLSDAQNGAVTFSIAASGYDAAGQAVEGKLLLKATEVRGNRTAQTDNYATNPVKKLKLLSIRASTAPSTTSGSDSCFVGTGAFPSANAVVTGTAESPQGGSQSPTAFAEFVNNLHKADQSGSAPMYDALTGYATNLVMALNPECIHASTAIPLMVTSSSTRLDYFAAAHVMELTPIELQFSTPLSGAWNSTLTVTAYTM
ncbi:hypothetical protein AB7Z36_04055 [Providencia rettgeri]